MPRRPPQRFAFDALQIDPDAARPIYRQLEQGLRDAILAGQLKPSERLPSTRRLAEDLQIARNTVSLAYAQLMSEGYLEAEVGSGTRVSRHLPDDLLKTPPPPRSVPPATVGPTLARRGERVAQLGAWISLPSVPPRPFRPHVPALDLFPRHVWRRLSERRLRRMPWHEWGQVLPLGYQPLRQAVAEYLGVSRGVRCSADQIVIVAGAQQAIEFVSRLLLDEGDVAWMEEPGYTPARHVFELAGVEVVSVPLDDEGLSVTAGQERNANARLAYVTPSSQWPTGLTMSLPRRLELLDWARRQSAWILEDDYNGEFRYDGRPLPAIQGLAASGHVVYMGTFSKVMFPGLRLGYLVIPDRLRDAFRAARWLADRHSPPFEQAVLTDFIEEGHFARHVRRMRTAYAARQQALLESLDRHLGGAVEIIRHETGLQLLVHAASGTEFHSLAAAAERAGVESHLLSLYAAEELPREGMILGFAAYNEDQIEQAVQDWAAEFDRH
ncbi:MocR-like pyridoxine biosynthesis transcription factor PdxR [Maioricimonas rarisocia]|nr:PLP-dependent aminotransferase family protein [Maioricimonas rarisocia]